MEEKGRKRILVVEDNEQNREVVSRMLELGGFETFCAPDAESGIDEVKKRRPDLVLMDIQLPGLDGLAAVRMLRQAPETRDVKIVALTAYAMNGDRERMIAGGCDDYLAKPIRYRELIAKIRALLGE